MTLCPDADRENLHGARFAHLPARCMVRGENHGNGAETGMCCARQGIQKDDSGQVSALTGELHLEGSVKATKLKLTWLPQARSGQREAETQHRAVCKSRETSLTRRNHIAMLFAKASPLVLRLNMPTIVLQLIMVLRPTHRAGLKVNHSEHKGCRRCMAEPGLMPLLLQSHLPKNALNILRQLANVCAERRPGTAVLRRLRAPDHEEEARGRRQDRGPRQPALSECLRSPAPLQCATLS